MNDIKDSIANHNPRGLCPRGLWFRFVRLLQSYSSSNFTYGFALTCALVFGPKNPMAGEMPLAFWYSTTAAFVWPPKKPVAPAGIEYPFLSKRFWSAETSAPVAPTSRSLENELTAETPAAGVAIISAFTCAFIASEMLPPCASSCAMRDFSVVASAEIWAPIPDDAVVAGAIATGAVATGVVAGVVAVGVALGAALPPPPPPPPLVVAKTAPEAADSPLAFKDVIL